MLNALISNVSAYSAPHVTSCIRLPPSFDPVVIGELVFQAAKSTLQQGLKTLANAFE